MKIGMSSNVNSILTVSWKETDKTPGSPLGVAAPGQYLASWAVGTPHTAGVPVTPSNPCICLLFLFIPVTTVVLFRKRHFTHIIYSSCILSCLSPKVSHAFLVVLKMPM